MNTKEKMIEKVIELVNYDLKELRYIDEKHIKAKNLTTNEYKALCFDAFMLEHYNERILDDFENIFLSNNYLVIEWLIDEQNDLMLDSIFMNEYARPVALFTYNDEKTQDEVYLYFYLDWSK